MRRSGRLGREGKKMGNIEKKAFFCSNISSIFFELFQLRERAREKRMEERERELERR